MKKYLLSIGLLMLVLSSCADEKTIDGVTYRPYGFFNEDLYKNDSIQYRVSPWAAVSGVIFCEFIAPPIYTYGYNLWEPVGKKSAYVNNAQKGVVK